MSDGTFYHPGVCTPNNRSIVVAILDLSILNILTYQITTLDNYPPTNPALGIASRAERSERSISREGSTINLLYHALTDRHREFLEKAGFTSCEPSFGAWQHLYTQHPTPSPVVASGPPVGTTLGVCTLPRSLDWMGWLFLSSAPILQFGRWSGGWMRSPIRISVPPNTFIFEAVVRRVPHPPYH